MWQRLGKNLGRYHGETIPIWDVLAEIDQLAIGSEWTNETFYSGEFSLSAYTRTAGPQAKRFYVSSGMHGDEPSGLICVLELFRQRLWPVDLNITLVPCLNPRGFELNTRENELGIDLNRDYRNPRTPQVQAHVKWLLAQPAFDLGILLHEDWEANGFYTYELNPQNRPSLAEPIIAEVSKICPIQESGPVDAFESESGVIRPIFDPAARPDWAEAIWLVENKTPQNYTLETPSDFPLEVRVKAHLAAIQTVFIFLA